MPLDLSYVGRAGEPTTRSWTTKDTLLYAVAVGAGHDDPQQELSFTTENSSVPHQVLPSFICGAGGAVPEGFRVDGTKLLHAEMSFELFDDVPAEATVTSTARVDSIYDKGSGALFSIGTDVVESTSGRRLARLESGSFVRGEGGYGGDHGPRDEWTVPDREPDSVVRYGTLREQALIYRLTGDRNPLHSDPEFARRAGFDAPILHGMCTYGFTARALLHAVADSDPSAFGGMYGRFSKTVRPGEVLDVQIWRSADGAVFRTLDARGDVVLDRGRMTLRGRR